MKIQLTGYMLLDHLGSGAMGDVYQAIEHRTGQMVAIKVLKQIEHAQRFNHEAMILAKLNHPNITRIFDYQANRNHAFIVMEYVEGLTLSKLISRQGKLPETFTLNIIRQLAGALIYLHQKDCIHRDIKASNIKVTKDSKVKLLDFGIAKSNLATKLTAEGFVVGSGYFMAPEQYNNTVTTKIDMWALGVLMYQMTTGHLPFSNENEIALRKTIEKGKYMKPEIFNPNISNKSRRIIKGLLQIQPKKRPSAIDLVQLIESPGPGKLFSFNFGKRITTVYA